MTADDFSAPLGQELVKRRRMRIEVPYVVASALALFFTLFVVWVIVGDGSFGGEPTVTVPIDRHAVKVVTKPEAMPPPQPAARGQTPGPAERPAVTAVPASAPPPNQAAPASTRTVTIIDGKTGARQEVVIPAAPPAIDEAADRPLPAPQPRRGKQ